MTFAPRVLDDQPVTDLAAYLSGGGGAGLAAARLLDQAGIIAVVTESGLRGRGGAGFPTGVKWQTVLDNLSPNNRATVVVNGSEGEPGCFKDRALLLANPYRVLEGALIAAFAVDADHVIFGLNETFTEPIQRVEGAIAEAKAHGWFGDVAVDVVRGPDEYLFGEETGLLEALDGRPPFPRVAPPYRHGAEEIGDGDGSAAEVEMAGSQRGDAPPTLANNVETIANIAGIVANGAAWFREYGTEQSPGTIVCTVTGSTRHAGVQEFPLGTLLREVIDTAGGGPVEGGSILAVLSGVANTFVTAQHLDTPLTYEAMAEIGSGLGAAGFMVFDETDDLVAVTQGASRFLAIESCGQCTPCKQDGLAIAETLDRFCQSVATEGDVDRLSELLDTVAVGARCNLAQQQVSVVGSLLAQFPAALAVHLEDSEDRVGPVEPVLIAPVTTLVDDGTYTIDENHRTKKPDWTHDRHSSGAAPADRLATPEARDES